MLPMIAQATHQDWQAVSRMIRTDAMRHGMSPADADDCAQAVCLRLLKLKRPLPPNLRNPLLFAATGYRNAGRRFGYHALLQSGRRTPKAERAAVAATRRAMGFRAGMPGPDVIAEQAERPARVAETKYYRDRMAADGLCDSDHILEAYGVGKHALAEPGWTPDVVEHLGHTPPQVTRGVPAAEGDGTAVRTLPFDLEAEYARAAANRAARAEQTAEDRPWWAN